MKFQGITGNFTEANVEALAVAVFKGEKADERRAQGSRQADRRADVARSSKSEEFKGDAGETALLRFAAKGQGKGDAVCCSSVSVTKSDYKPSRWSRVVAGTATRFLAQSAI